MTEPVSRRYAVTECLTHIAAKPKSDLTLIDLEHLSRQTMDDKALQSEVLRLFHQQLLGAKDVIQVMAVSDRRDLAHLLEGAAKAVGAFSFAETLKALTHDPANRGSVERAAEQIDSLLAHLCSKLGREDVLKG